MPSAGFLVPLVVLFAAGLWLAYEARKTASTYRRIWPLAYAATVVSSVFVSIPWVTTTHRELTSQKGDRSILFESAFMDLLFAGIVIPACTIPLSLAFVPPSGWPARTRTSIRVIEAAWVLACGGVCAHQ